MDFIPMKFERICACVTEIDLLPTVVPFLKDAQLFHEWSAADRVWRSICKPPIPLLHGLECYHQRLCFDCFTQTNTALRNPNGDGCILMCEYSPDTLDWRGLKIPEPEKGTWRKPALRRIFAKMTAFMSKPVRMRTRKQKKDEKKSKSKSKEKGKDKGKKEKGEVIPLRKEGDPADDTENYDYVDGITTRGSLDADLQLPRWMIPNVLFRTIVKAICRVLIDQVLALDEKWDKTEYPARLFAPEHKDLYRRIIERGEANKLEVDREVVEEELARMKRFNEQVEIDLKNRKKNKNKSSNSSPNMNDLRGIEVPIGAEATPKLAGQNDEVQQSGVSILSESSAGDGKGTGRFAENLGQAMMRTMWNPDDFYAMKRREKEEAARQNARNAKGKNATPKSIKTESIDELSDKLESSSIGISSATSSVRKKELEEVELVKPQFQAKALNLNGESKESASGDGAGGEGAGVDKSPGSSARSPAESKEKDGKLKDSEEVVDEKNSQKDGSDAAGAGKVGSPVSVEKDPSKSQVPPQPKKKVSTVCCGCGHGK